MYNRKFNCFVRPKYDGSHQTFPGLDLKALGGCLLYTSPGVKQNLISGNDVNLQELGAKYGIDFNLSLIHI